MTYELILKRMLDKIPNTIDKREGSIIYDALAPAAIELRIIYIELDIIMRETFGDTASRVFLIKRAAERGLHPKPATKPILKGLFNIDVPIGSRYSLEDLNYVITEKIGDGVFKLECENIGSEGNRHFGKIIPIEYIKGLGTAEITELLIPGEDAEDTESFRYRYLNSFSNQAYGGNIEDYKEKVHTIQGIGGVKVHPVWNGGGTVKLVIMNSEYQVPTIEMIATVQTIIDPERNHGEGLGVAPIGHNVTVVGVTATVIDIELNIILKNGFRFEDLQSTIETIIDDYFIELNKKWENSNNTIIRISQIESRLLDIENIIDIQNTKINGVYENYSLDSEAIAVRGEVSASS